jgi:hypothetical protein
MHFEFLVRSSLFRASKFGSRISVARSKQNRESRHRAIPGCLLNAIRLLVRLFARFRAADDEFAAEKLLVVQFLDCALGLIDRLH